MKLKIEEDMMTEDLSISDVGIKTGKGKTENFNLSVYNDLRNGSLSLSFKTERWAPVMEIEIRDGSIEISRAIGQGTERLYINSEGKPVWKSFKEEGERFLKIPFESC